MIEDINTEFKREYTEDIKYAVLAFANTDGGKILIGVEDDGTPCGISDIDGTMLKLTNMIRDSIHPDITMFSKCHALKMDGKDVIELTVHRGTTRPYYLHSKGIRPSGVYVRQGASSVPASETAIMNLIKETYGDSYEEAVSLNQDLTFDAAGKYFENKDLPFSDANKKSLHLIAPDGTYTNLGMLLSDQCAHTIKFVVYNGNTGDRYQNREIYTGSLLKQADVVVQAIECYNELSFEIDGIWRKDQKSYPKSAIREMVLNAIVHRDYSVRASTLISVFSDRIECLSYGRLVTGLDIDDLGTGVSILRNEHLGNIFYRLGLIEQYGTGIRKIQEGYKGTGLEPKIELTSNTFKMILPNMNKAKKERSEPETYNDNLYFYDRPPVYMSDREHAVLKLIAEKGKIIRKEVDTLLNISQSTASLLLKDMVNKGLIIKQGNGPSSIYMQKRN